MKEIKNVLFVVNPISGNNNKDTLIRFVKKQCNKMHLNLSIYTTEGENDEKNIKEILNNENIDRILVAGGDGTIKMVAEAKMEIDKGTPLGIFPQGSANGLALNLMIPDTKEEQLNVALGENIIYMDAVNISNNISLHLADFGLNAELIKNFENSELRGKVGYLVQAIPTLIKSNYPFEFEIQTKEGTYTKEGSVLSIANCQKYGTGASINPKGKMDDGKFEVIIFKNLNLVDSIKTLTNNSSLNPDFAETYSCTSVKIKCKKHLPFQVDGEYIGELKEVDVSILKNRLPIAVPECFSEV